MKKITLGLILGVALAVSGSVFAESWNAVATPFVKLTPAEQIAKGFVFNQYTGEKLVQEVKLSPTELRFRALEARVSALEAKKK